jgi:hypothetical protein
MSVIQGVQGKNKENGAARRAALERREFAVPLAIAQISIILA